MNNNSILRHLAITMMLIALSIDFVFSQTPCPNIDFSAGDFTNWIGRYGQLDLWNPNPGIIPGRHQIITTPGTDPRTGGLLSVLPPGKNVGARLGDWNPAARFQRLSYTLDVNPENALVVISYALVLQNLCNPGEPQNQPRFTLEVLDASGNNIPDCGYFEVYAQAGIPGFQNGPNGVRWKNWSDFPVDLCNYVGSQVTIELTTYDCRLTTPGHYGYAYLSGNCQPMQINVNFCENGDTAVLTAPDGFVSYTWSPGNLTGQSITIQNPVPGAEYSCFMETEIEGLCGATLTAILDQIIIQPAFEMNYIEDCKVVFQDQTTISNDAIASWFWEFGDGSTATLQNPEHAYLSAGTYDVRLTVFSVNGCSNAITQPVLIQMPEADFSTENRCLGDTIFLFNSSIVPEHSEIISWKWNMGDGTTKEGPDIHHVFAEPGSYDVQLIIETNLSCTATVVKPVLVHHNPVAAFTFENICIGDEMVFISESFIASGDPLSFYWTTDDGHSYENMATMVHRFADTGTYSVKLTAISTYGCIDEITIPVTVHPLPFVDFSADPPEGCPPLQVQFTNLSEDGEYTWDFGNAMIKAGSKNLVQTFSEPGFYDVSLTVVSEHGCVNTMTRPALIHAYPLPQADFTPKPLIVNTTKPTITFTDKSMDAVRWIWDFGDEATSEPSGEGTVKHDYQEPGEYIVKLTVFNDFDCSDTITKSVFVLPGPDALLPNAFSPNGDGHNDIFSPIISSEDISGFSMMIFDRWGGKVYETNDIITGWDGTDLRSGRKVPQGVYSYIVFVTMYGVSEKYAGSVMVIY